MRLPQKLQKMLSPIMSLSPSREEEARSGEKNNQKPLQIGLSQAPARNFTQQVIPCSMSY